MLDYRRAAPSRTEAPWRLGRAPLNWRFTRWLGATPGARRVSLHRMRLFLSQGQPSAAALQNGQLPGRRQITSAGPTLLSIKAVVTRFRLREPSRRCCRWPQEVLAACTWEQLCMPYFSYLSGLVPIVAGCGNWNPCPFIGGAPARLFGAAERSSPESCLNGTSAQDAWGDGRSESSRS